MADFAIEPDHMRSCRCLLETTLQCLDQAGLHQVAAHVDMALILFEQDQHQTAEGPRTADASLHQFNSPLDTENIKILYRDIINQNYADEDSVLRRAYEILTDRRRETGAYEAQTSNADRFGAYLSAGAYTNAALTLMEPGAGYMVSSGSTGSFLASVVLPGMESDVSAEGAEFATALVAAYLAALIVTSCQNRY